MNAGIWRTPFGMALLIHLIIISALGYVLREGLKEEIHHIEVTMTELFAEQPATPAGGGGQPKAQDDTQQQAASAPMAAAAMDNTTVQNIPAQSQQSADASSVGLTSTGVSSGGGGGGGFGSGSGTGGSGGGSGGGIGTGTGTGVGPGHGQGRGASVLSSGRPPYPPEARRNGWEGRVVVSVLVSEDGSPASVSVAGSSGYDCLDDAAVRAVRDWSFNPALDDDGLPMEVWKNVAVRFDLNDAG